jgi:hypothetical protein
MEKVNELAYQELISGKEHLKSLKKKNPKKQKNPPKCLIESITEPKKGAVLLPFS